MSDLVGNPEDRFSGVEAQMFYAFVADFLCWLCFYLRIHIDAYSAYVLFVHYLLYNAHFRQVLPVWTFKSRGMTPDFCPGDPGSSPLGTSDWKILFTCLSSFSDYICNDTSSNDSKLIASVLR